MNIFALEVFDDEGEQCTFYTVRWDESSISETDKFFEKYESDPDFEQPIEELAVFITRKIGDEEGALEEFFRFENDAQALPPTGRHRIGEITINYGNFPLRLFCLRLSDSLVVLFNGCEKTGKTAQGGRTSMAFSEANRFTKRILQAIQEKELYISEDGRTFRNFDDNKEIIL